MKGEKIKPFLKNLRLFSDWRFCLLEYMLSEVMFSYNKFEQTKSLFQLTRILQLKIVLFALRWDSDFEKKEHFGSRSTAKVDLAFDLENSIEN